MKKKTWQLGEVRMARFTFQHVAGQRIWFEAKEPIPETCISFSGEWIKGIHYISQLLDWEDPPKQLWFQSSWIELLPQFLIDEDPPLIPFEEWSRPDYIIYRDRERLA